MSFTNLLALRYFRAKKNEKFVSIISAISLAGIAIGVAALIVVMSVMNGFHIELVSNIIGLNGDLNITPMERSIENYDEVAVKVLSHPEVVRVNKVVQGQALATGLNVSSGVLIKGMSIADLKHKGEILNNVLEGDFVHYTGKNVVAIGSELAWKLGLREGSVLKLISPNMISSAFGSMPRARNFTVIAVFTSGLYEYDAATVLMPLEAAQLFLGLKDGANLMEVNITEPDNARSVTRELQKELGFGLKVTSWQAANVPFLSALEIERVAMFAILSLIILVAAFNIISSLFMVVKDKSKDIAILRTIGASRKQIMIAFIKNGMLTGMIGTGIGVALGLFFAKNVEKIRIFLESMSGLKIFDPAIYFLYQLPSVVRYSDILLIGGMSIVICFLATIYPAYKASSLNPVEAMRYE